MNAVLRSAGAGVQLRAMEIPADLAIAKGMPAAGCSLEEAQAYTRGLATSHYENFNVVSWMLPRGLHQSFYNVYAYCRWADDLGDEIPDAHRALALLDQWEEELRRCYEGRATHPVLIALAETAREHDIPQKPFADLLIAFRRDQTVKRHPDWASVLDYCVYSANPVGRIVLYVCGYRDPARQELSDWTCTALQLANFWQDVARDLDIGRIYIPLDHLAAHGLSVADLEARRFDAQYARMMKELVEYTRTLFARGRPLARNISGPLRTDIDMFSRGGIAVLDAIEAIGYNTIEHRPAISRRTQARLLGRALVSRLFSPLLHGSRTDAEPGAGGPANAAPEREQAESKRA
ncbi:MAG TPA: squalene synthase HpnC [Candidatus Acidoferrales bacterium]|nr:squalene synthase HpnC [Candidatus Acidoferrales bacterium]